MFGRDMVINAKYLANWKAINAHRHADVHCNNQCENASHILHMYHAGDSVYLITKDIQHKLNMQEGPFPIFKFFPTVPS